jgi:stage V sporulation protein R
MASMLNTSLPPEMAEIQARMESYARGYGLDFFPTVFELVDADELNAVAAFGGFPTRYPHWRFGMEYEQLAKGYVYGLQKIYELVINNDPCYAYLMRSNELTDQKLVMAHVYGHCDFFKNNYYFSHTNRKMVDTMANHGHRIRTYMDRVGVEEVENFIDACLSIEDLIDIHAPFIKRREPEHRRPSDEDDERNADGPSRFEAKGYMDRYINPPAALQREQDELDQARRDAAAAVEPLPRQPELDVMLFLMEHAPLKSWQSDVLSIIRDEAYYFAPQAQTKIMNEGWASYWHSTIMTTQGLSGADLICYCDHHSGTLASSPSRLNPYKLGIELFRDIEDRWNRGQFGKEWDECDDARAKEQWNRETGLGRQKIFEVRRIHNDLTFIDEFLTLDFCRRHKLFKFGWNPDADAYEIESRAFPQVKQQLLANLTNRGRPQIAVRDANHRNRGELLLQHYFEGEELDEGYARDTLAALYTLWKRPVHVQSVMGDRRVIISFDGKDHDRTELGEYRHDD